MSTIDIIRAWKDEEYRQSLTAEQLAQLPDNPAGLVELTDTELAQVVGATAPVASSKCSCCGTSCCAESLTAVFTVTW